MAQVALAIKEVLWDDYGMTNKFNTGANIPMFDDFDQTWLESSVGRFNIDSIVYENELIDFIDLKSFDQSHTELGNIGHNLIVANNNAASFVFSTDIFAEVTEREMQVNTNARLTFREENCASALKSLFHDQKARLCFLNRNYNGIVEFEEFQFPDHYVVRNTPVGEVIPNALIHESNNILFASDFDLEYSVAIFKSSDLVPTAFYEYAENEMSKLCDTYIKRWPSYGGGLNLLKKHVLPRILPDFWVMSEEN